MRMSERGKEKRHDFFDEKKIEYQISEEETNIETKNNDKIKSN